MKYFTCFKSINWIKSLDPDMTWIVTIGKLKLRKRSVTVLLRNAFSFIPQPPTPPHPTQTKTTQKTGVLHRRKKTQNVWSKLNRQQSNPISKPSLFLITSLSDGFTHSPWRCNFHWRASPDCLATNPRARVQLIGFYHHLKLTEDHSQDLLPKMPSISRQFDYKHS